MEHTYGAWPHLMRASQQHCLDAVLQLLAWELQFATAEATLLHWSPALWDHLLRAGRQLK